MAKRPGKNAATDLHFVGERQSPDTPQKTLERRFVMGDRKIPEELERLRNAKSIYVSGERKPEVHLEKIEVKDNHAVWKIDIPVKNDDPQLAHARMGQTAVRKKPEFYQRQVDSTASFSAFRPAWADATFSPRILFNRPYGSMRRINGRATDPLYLFGNDDRVAFRDASWPWGLVGKVINSRGESGTASLIGDRIIATAGHLIPWGDKDWWIRFVPAYYDNASLYGAGVESYVSDVNGYDVDGDVTGYDWAVCRLYEPLGSMLGYFGYNGYSSDWENDPYWMIIGYPGAIAGGQRPSFQGNLTSFDNDGDSHGGLEIETEADLTPGNSGGPMFGWWNGDPRLIGVVSGEETDWDPGVLPWQWGDTEKGNVIAGGSGFTNLMAWGRDNYPL